MLGTGVEEAGGEPERGEMQRHSKGGMSRCVRVQRSQGINIIIKIMRWRWFSGTIIVIKCYSLDIEINGHQTCTCEPYRTLLT